MPVAPGAPRLSPMLVLSWPNVITFCVQIGTGIFNMEVPLAVDIKVNINLRSRKLLMNATSSRNFTTIGFQVEDGIEKYFFLSSFFPTRLEVKVSLVTRLGSR